MTEPYNAPAYREGDLLNTGPASPVSTELAQLLDSYELAARRDTTYSHRGLDAARAAISDLFGNLASELAAAEAVSQELVDDFNEISERCARLRSENQRLRETGLTAEQAELLLGEMHHDDDCATKRIDYAEDCDCQSENIIEKLSALRSLAASPVENT